MGAAEKSQESLRYKEWEKVATYADSTRHWFKPPSYCAFEAAERTT